MKHNRALDAAVALSRTPTRATAMRAQELPTGVNLLLRILVGDAEALSEARNSTGLRDQDLLVIAELYVLKVMLFRGASARRILGVGFGADRREMPGKSVVKFANMLSSCSESMGATKTSKPVRAATAVE